MSFVIEFNKNVTLVFQRIVQILSVISVNKKTQELDKKCSNSGRLSKFGKCEFTMVNGHFESKHNVEVGLSLQELINLLKYAKIFKDLDFYFGMCVGDVGL